MVEFRGVEVELGEREWSFANVVIVSGELSGVAFHAKSPDLGMSMPVATCYAHITPATI